jgi:hypothetical protein
MSDIVLVKWHDAKFFTGTYNNRAILEHKMALFESIGYLIARDKTTTTIAAEKNDQDEYRDITLIPSGSVISISKLMICSAV